LVTPAIAGLTLPEPVKDFNVPADAAGTAGNFRHTLRTLEPGKLYEIEAVPVNSAILGLAVLKLETDCPLSRQQLHQAFLVVRKPPARPAAP
jgi:hypothetical protein